MKKVQNKVSVKEAAKTLATATGDKAIKLADNKDFDGALKSLEGAGLNLMETLIEMGYKDAYDGSESQEEFFVNLISFIKRQKYNNNPLKPAEFGKRLGELSTPIILVDYLSQENLWKVEGALLELMCDAANYGTSTVKAIANAYMKAQPIAFK